jgi:hypothetical protein
MTLLRAARLASAAISARSTAAVDSRSSHSAIGSSVRRARLRAKARVDCARGPSGQFEDAPRIDRETLARDGFDRRCDPPIGIAGGDANGLAAEIKADQRATLRQQHGGISKCENRHGMPLARTAG